MNKVLIYCRPKSSEYMAEQTASILYEQLQQISKEQLFTISKNNNIIPENLIINFESPKEMYSIFEHINNYILDKYKK